MTSRTWTERGAWMDKHPDDIDVSEYTKKVARAIDALIDEHARQDTASRSPVAAFCKKYESDEHRYPRCSVIEDLRAAIRAQADAWRKEANGIFTGLAAQASPPWTLPAASGESGRANALRRCADELEGK